MKVSGFTFIKNATKLYLPFKEALLSVLPLVDEFVIALGDCDPDDQTSDLISSIASSKIKVIHTVWDYQKYPKGAEFAHQTDLAKAACTGDWLFYIQGDEVIHEDDQNKILDSMKKYDSNRRVEGILFDYLHFYGDYEHIQKTHGWYKKEIRIIRNDPDIHSWRDAQSFRRIPQFDGLNYHQREGTQKLNVVESGARIFHYGWVRPPQYLKRKQEERKSNYQKKEGLPLKFYYGPLGVLPKFQGTHPSLMKAWIDRFNWSEELNYGKIVIPGTGNFKYMSLRNRLHTFIENNFFGGQGIGDFKNYNLIKDLK